MKNDTWRILNTNHVVITNLNSIYNEALQLHFQVFTHMEFMLHQAEGLPPHRVWNAYRDEEIKFLKTFREIPIHKVQKNSIIITSRITYKVKNDDGSL